MEGQEKKILKIPEETTGEDEEAEGHHPTQAVKKEEKEEREFS